MAAMTLSMSLHFMIIYVDPLPVSLTSCTYITPPHLPVMHTFVFSHTRLYPAHSLIGLSLSENILSSGRHISPSLCLADDLQTHSLERGAVVDGAEALHPCHPPG